MIRKLKLNDYFKNYLELINNFTKNINKITFIKFKKKFLNQISNEKIFIYEENNKIIGNIKIIKEQKFHNNFMCVLHIEDLIVHKNYRKKGIATKLINYILEHELNNCYKIVLNCNNELITFYKQFNFNKKGIEMCYYLK